MKIALLRRFVGLVEHDLHFPRAAAALGIPLASLYTTVDKLAEETGQPLLAGPKNAPMLTPAGRLLVEEARLRIAEAPAPAPKPAAPAGGKAKASKGKGRAPVVKGQPKPYKKRQGR